MASRIDPDPKPKSAAVPPKPAAPKPAAARPAAAPAKPAGPPPAAGKPGVAAAQPSAAAAQADGDDDDGPAVSAGLLKQAPAWAVSMLVHIVALLAMALIVTEPPKKEAAVSIVSSAPEVDDNFEELDPEPPAEDVQPTEVTADVAVPTDVTVVEPVDVVSVANDPEAAPLTVEVSDFGSETAPATDMLATIGVAGGTGKAGFGHRGGNTAAKAGQGGGGADTEAAVDRALKWIAAHQLQDGSWSFNFKDCPQCNGQCSGDGSQKDRAGATAMAILPFLGRGFTHKEGPYKKTVENGVAYLAGLSMQNQGAVYGKGAGHAGLYIQGLAGIALSESYGMTQDGRLQAPAQYALDHIMAAQDKAGGGWRYHVGQPGDTSVVGWQLMALKSGHMAYLNVEANTIKKAIEFLDSVKGDEYGSTYGYTGPGSGPGTTAVGLLCRMYLGWKKDNQGLQMGVERFAKTGPNQNLYFSYYATQIMHHMEGDIWLAWNDKMKKLLLPSQATKGHEAGSWFMTGSGDHNQGGRLYCTSLATMMLEVYYRHLPIYSTQSVDEEFQE